MIKCEGCKKPITWDGLKVLQRRGYNVHEYIDDRYCPHCGDQIYESDPLFDRLLEQQFEADVASGKIKFSE